MQFNLTILSKYTKKWYEQVKPVTYFIIVIKRKGFMDMHGDMAFTVINCYEASCGHLSIVKKIFGSKD